MTDKPDWEGFSRRVLHLSECPGSCYDIDGRELFDVAVEFNLFKEIPGGFDPEIHDDDGYGSEPGDPWYDFNFPQQP